MCVAAYWLDKIYESWFLSTHNIFHYKTNCFVKIHWLKDTQMVTSHSSQQKIALTTYIFLPITSAPSHAFIYAVSYHSMIPKSPNPNFPLPSGCEAGRGGVHISRRDDLHFRWWIYQVGSAFNRIAGVVGLCWGGWTSDGDYWVTCLGGGWSLLGGVFSYHEFEWIWTGICGKVSEFGHGIFSKWVWSHQLGD